MNFHHLTSDVFETSLQTAREASQEILDDEMGFNDDNPAGAHQVRTAIRLASNFAAMADHIEMLQIQAEVEGDMNAQLGGLDDDPAVQGDMNAQLGS
uniref:Uncharacterized protein n=1 Tax=Meloidogyne javanica TaxID=6303 RepID=A0A915LYE8_MELJA